MSASPPTLSGLVPANLRVRSARIVLDGLEVQADIGFHDFEIGSPQRLLVSVEVWLNDLDSAGRDHPAEAWNYDFLRTEVAELAGARRYNLQETLAHAISSGSPPSTACGRSGSACRSLMSIRTRKAVGVEVASFPGLWPEG